ncbi:MAG: homoserine kinase [Acidobacteria bacterium]|nr:homoserine kinase [Acidobacteriota bacterium]
MGWKVRVPASSANLGPGFDALGLALDIPLECRFRVANKFTLSVTGRDAAEIPATEENLIWQTALRVAREFGRETLPPVAIEIDNQIPLGKGLGSSAAALTAGVVIAEKLLGLGWKPLRILDEAAQIEGHPDNVAAAVLGSIVASAFDTHTGATRAVRLELPSNFGVSVVVPDFILPTSEARAALPQSYSREDAVFNVQRAALLVAAFATGSSAAFPAALEDRMHQPYRAKLVPGLDEILRLRAPGLLGCVLSGAGPSILVFYETGCESVSDLVRQIFRLHGRGSEIFPTRIDPDGLQVTDWVADPLSV